LKEGGRCGETGIGPNAGHHPRISNQIENEVLAAEDVQYISDSDIRLATTDEETLLGRDEIHTVSLHVFNRGYSIEIDHSKN